MSLYRITLLKGFFEISKNYMGFFTIITELAVFVIVISAAAVYLYRKNKGIINDHLAY